MPLLRVCLCYALGIFVANISEHIQYDLINLLLINCILLLCLQIAKQLWRIGTIPIIYCCLFVCGFYNYTLSQSQLNQDYFGNASDAELVLATVKDVSQTKKYLKTTVEVDSLVFSRDTQKTTLPASGNALVYLKPKDERPKEGDQILFEYKFQSPASNPNPKTFDYKRFLFFQYINKVAFVEPDKWVKVQQSKTLGLEKHILHGRYWLRKILDDHFDNADYAAILKAISIGDRTGISGSLNQAFVDTGAVHVLAISGLHVGIVAGLFLLLLKLSKPILLKYLIAIIALLSIWLFVLISGAGPSVKRAALMFSLFITTKLTSHQVSIYNVLGGSALILLCFDPYLLFQLGFQYSYLAVISIVSFYPVLKRFGPSMPAGFSFLYDIFLVSIAAQILVGPLSVYHFHQISTMSSVSSLIAIPAISFLLYALVCLIAFSSIGFSNLSLIVQFMDWVLAILTQSIYYLSSMSNCKLEGFYPNTLNVVSVYLLLFSALFLIKRERLSIYLFALALLGFAFNNVITSNQIKNETQDQLLVYATKSGVVLDCFIADQNFSYTSDLTNNRDLEFNCNPYRKFKKPTQTFELFKSIDAIEMVFIEIKGDRMCLVKNMNIDFPICTDYLFLLGNSKIAEDCISQVECVNIYSETNQADQIQFIQLPPSEPIII